MLIPTISAARDSYFNGTAISLTVTHLSLSAPFISVADCDPLLPSALTLPSHHLLIAFHFPLISPPHRDSFDFILVGPIFRQRPMRSRPCSIHNLGCANPMCASNSKGSQGLGSCSRLEVVLRHGYTLYSVCSTALFFFSQ